MDQMVEARLKKSLNGRHNTIVAAANPEVDGLGKRTLEYRKIYVKIVKNNWRQTA